MADFSTVLARLLSDGALRDAFAADRKAALAGFSLGGDDQQALENLDPEDLEFQAEILLRKRFDLVLRHLPTTCRKLPGEGRPDFIGYARCRWSGGEFAQQVDALEFCRFLRTHRPGAVDAEEENRLVFATSGRRWAWFGILSWDEKGRRRPAGQILFRWGNRIREFRIRLSL